MRATRALDLREGESRRRQRRCWADGGSSRRGSRRVWIVRDELILHGGGQARRAESLEEDHVARRHGMLSSLR